MSGWRRGLWSFGALGLAWMIVDGAIQGDWMASTAGMAGLAMALPFWLRAERDAAARAALGGDDA